MTCERIHHVFRKRVGSGTAEDAKRAGTSLCTCLCTQNIAQKASPFSVARLKMDLPFHNRLVYSRVHGGVPALLSLSTNAAIHDTLWAGHSVGLRKECGGKSI